MKVFLILISALLFNGCLGYQESLPQKINQKLSGSSYKEDSYDGYNMFVNKKMSLEKDIKVKKYNFSKLKKEYQSISKEALLALFNVSNYKDNSNSKNELSILFKEKKDYIVVYIELKNKVTYAKIQKKAIYYKKEDIKTFKLFIVNNILEVLNENSLYI
jgi:hypothetical protein